MRRPRRSPYPLPLIERIRTTFWVTVLGVGMILLMDCPLIFSPNLLTLVTIVTLAVGVAGLRHQLRRNAYAYLEGKPRPVITHRTPRPIRSAGKGEVHRTGRSFRGLLGRMLGRVPNYREFPKKVP